MFYKNLMLICSKNVKVRLFEKKNNNNNPKQKEKRKNK